MKVLGVRKPKSNEENPLVLICQFGPLFSSFGQQLQSGMHL